MDTTDTDPYRPRCIEDMAGATDWMRLRALLTRADPPNVVLAGGAGTGKSCALRMALGSTITMWLRCSQDPTLRDSRDRIKAAARRRVAGVGANWIVLEHADLLHADAQAFLRRIIETSTGACRFVLEVRDVAAIAEPLLSRTMMFVAPQLVGHEIRTEIMRRSPGVTREIAERIAGQSGGNVRWAVLQGLGGGEGMIANTMPAVDTVTSWADVLAAMEALQRTGTAPKAWLGAAVGGDLAWERAGGACPWALTALALASRMAT
jgi:hypothetical protein